jgi:hypothetical protein
VCGVRGAGDGPPHPHRGGQLRRLLLRAEEARGQGAKVEKQIFLLFGKLVLIVSLYTSNNLLTLCLLNCIVIHFLFFYVGGGGLKGQ